MSGHARALFRLLGSVGVSWAGFQLVSPHSGFLLSVFLLAPDVLWGVAWNAGFSGSPCCEGLVWDRGSVPALVGLRLGSLGPAGSCLGAYSG